MPVMLSMATDWPVVFAGVVGGLGTGALLLVTFLLPPAKQSNMV